MNAKSDKLLRRTTMMATLTASYFLITADYGPEPNVLDPKKEEDMGENEPKIRQASQNDNNGGKSYSFLISFLLLNMALTQCS